VDKGKGRWIPPGEYLLSSFQTIDERLLEHDCIFSHEIFLFYDTNLGSEPLVASIQRVVELF
jgi:hypothetical protein